jgi:hypothetical protein
VTASKRERIEGEKRGRDAPEERKKARAEDDPAQQAT